MTITRGSPLARHQSLGQSGRVAILVLRIRRHPHAARRNKIRQYRCNVRGMPSRRGIKAYKPTPEFQLNAMR
jgi:hypothetical protein